MFLPAAQQISPCTHHFLKDYFTSFKNDLWIIISKMFSEHIFWNTFFEFGIYYSESKKNIL